jgi:hypothetical protein
MNTSAPDERISKIIELRELMARQSPGVAARQREKFATGIASLDHILGGGLWKGGIVELLAPRRSSGSASLLHGVLHQAAGRQLWTALIDGADSFDPQLAGAQTLSRLLWVRCHTAAEAMQSADLLLRDGNLPLICLDFCQNPPAQLRKIASTTWYRLQRMIEPTAVALLTLTRFPLIPCADVRLELENAFSLEDLEQMPAAILGRVKLTVRRQRQAQDTREEPLLRRAG